MRKLALLAVIFLAGCYTETTDESVNGFKVACMNGIEYYYNTAGGYGKSLAAVIDPETLTYVRCEEK